ncbi:MAG: hypothetical protein HYW05_01725 [Candidatus Diapherotrites archaeon]|nr:hypothetical protein [Candidatus Diapherotrites archaeon]
MRLRKPLKLKIPNERVILSSRGAWRVSDYHYKYQNTNPRDPSLLRKLGIAKRDKVLVFAGYFGRWAKALANCGAVVHYTDISQGFVTYAKKKFGHNQQFLRDKNIASFRARNALLIPQIKNKYDWSFSFEPIPLLNIILPFTLMRSLLNKKGAIVVSYTATKIFSEEIKKIAKIYNAKSRTKEIYIKCFRWQDKSVRNRLHEISILITNPAAQKMVENDLAVLRAARSKENVSLEELAEDGRIKQAKLGIEQIKQSIKRLSAISRDLSAAYSIKSNIA